ncbi:sensor histidine kinase [Sulfurimonas sp.]
MFKTLISKFTFFFWLLFLFATVPVYIFASFHFVNILNSSEKEKITIAVNTIKPIIALNISFNQPKQLEHVLNSLFENNDIQAIQLKSIQDLELYSKSTDRDYKGKLLQLKSNINDPFTDYDIATITITYSNQNLVHLKNEVYMVIFITTILALALFSLAYLNVRNDLKGLRIITNSLYEYSHMKNTKHIIQPSKTEEIQTIASVANQMLSNIAQYVTKLESFNIELEKRVAEEIQKQQNQEKMIVHQSRQAAMGEMLESIAHQWRQPLNIIGLASSSLETEYKLGLMSEDKFNEKMQIIAANINYMSDTIDDFRNFLNPQKEMSIFSPDKNIHEVLTIIDAELQNNNISYSLDINCNPFFYGVENEFKQVILILLNNSKDATKMMIDKKRIEHGNINISINCKDDYGIIEVKDNGGGIENNILDDIFNPYFTTKGNSNGTGIGLYIAKNIIKNRMNGELGVKNIEFGCCFTIKLPLKKREDI